jgi:hypothetical protein
VVSIPVHIPGQPFHRGEIKLHDDKILSKNSQGTAENDCISQYPKVYHKTMENDRKSSYRKCSQTPRSTENTKYTKIVGKIEKNAEKVLTLKCT